MVQNISQAYLDQPPIDEAQPEVMPAMGLLDCIEITLVNLRRLHVTRPNLNAPANGDYLQAGPCNRILQSDLTRWIGEGTFEAVPQHHDTGIAQLLRGALGLRLFNNQDSLVQEEPRIFSLPNLDENDNARVALREINQIFLNFNMSDSTSLDSIETKTGNSLMHLAAKANATMAIKVLAGLGVSSIATNKIGFVPLHLAAQTNSSAAILALGAIGSPANLVDVYDNTPLHIAAAVGAVAATQALGQLFANPNITNKQGHTPLFIATQNNNIQTIRALGELGADPDIVDDKLITPLIYATQENNIEAIRALGELRAHPNLAGNDVFLQI